MELGTVTLTLTPNPNSVAAISQRNVLVSSQLAGTELAKLTISI
jgi:hypothetical protein